MSKLGEELQKLVKQHEYISPQMCGCMGPQNGEPVCPCAMRFVSKIDGRYYRITDLGKAY